MLSEEQQMQIKQILIPILNPVFILVFGSYALGCPRKNSDIDIAFFCEDKNLDAYEVFLLAGELADALKTDVDLVDLSQATPVFQTQIFQTGKVIYCIDERKRVIEHAKALRMYADLNEQRQPVLKQIVQRGIFMENNVILNKIAIIERCMNRIDEVYNQDATNLNDDTKQDSLILNLQRCCEASIDLAMHIVAQKGLGIPQTSREAFDLLLQKQMISAELAKHLKAMVGFRNIAVHDYQALNLKILQQIIENHLEDFRSFAHQILVYDTKENE